MCKKLKIIIFSFLILVNYCSLFADTELSTIFDIPQHPLTIAELVDISLKNHPSTKKGWWNAKRASAAVGCAKSEYYPHLDAIGEVSHEKVRKFINGPDTECTSCGADLVLNMMLYDCGKTKAAVESAKKGLQAASWDMEMNVQKVLVNVFGRAYEMLHAQEVYEASLLSLQEAEKTFEAAEELNRVGLKPVFDVYSSKTDLIHAKIEARARKTALLISEAKLIVSLGLQQIHPNNLKNRKFSDTECLRFDSEKSSPLLDTGADFSESKMGISVKEKTDSSSYLSIYSLKLQPVEINDIPKKEQIEQLIAYSHEHRADLRSKQAAYEASLFDVEQEQNSSLPKISLFGKGGMSRSSHEIDHSGKASEISKLGQYTIGVKIEVPLFTGFEEMYKKQMALASANLTSAEIAELQLEISQDIATACYSLEAAQEMLPDAQKSLENAIKAYECSFERYMSGEGKIIELSDAQKSIASARVQCSDIKTQLLTAIANLAYATGTLK